MHLPFALYLPYGYKIDVSKISKFLASCSFTIILKVSCIIMFFHNFQSFFCATLSFIQENQLLKLFDPYICCQNLVVKWKKNILTPLILFPTIATICLIQNSTMWKKLLFIFHYYKHSSQFIGQESKPKLWKWKSSWSIYITHAQTMQFLVVNSKI
jgi:hypothetical protein